jgi:hypothetical protein
MTTTTKTISMADVDARAIVFTFGSADRLLVVEAEPETDLLKFWDRYGHEAKRADHANFADYGRFFAFWVADCFDPPIAIVRADSWENAYEIFLDEFERWIKIDEPDLGDYDEETLTYNSNGTPIDSEAVNGQEIKLVRIDC